MRAIRVHQFGDPSVLTVDEVPTPEPGAGQVQVRVHAAGVNPVDTYIRSGRYGVLPTLPYIPGSDGAGTISALGPGATRWKVGDRVFFHGTALGRPYGAYAEFTVNDEDKLYPLPANVGFAEGAALGVPYATAYRALFHRAHAKAGEIVLVHGASGGVGIAALQLARWKGLRVIGTAGSAPGLDLVRANGAHFAISHKEALYLDQIKAAADQGRGPDVILEMLANVNLDQDLDIIASYGRIVVIGNRGRIEIDPRKIMTRDAVVTGLTLWNASQEDLATIYRDLVTGLESGVLVPVIGQEWPFAEAARAHDAVMTQGAYGKIVLLP
ncbi:MAG: NADPH:quinone reductase [Gemmatimonadales bacterium]|nr:NADPH:quinone reductase [Gemmatimonadales bacterium]MDX2058455.1 NADPH:quinone reductase [Gemmatimonadales bacterium]